MKDFGLYLSISKGAKDAQLLFQYLKKYHPSFSTKALDKEVVANKLFKKDTNKAKKLTNSMQRCSRLLNIFLIQEELKMQTENQELLLLQAMKKRKLDSYFFRKADKLEKEWTKNPPPGLLTLHYLFRLKEMVFHHPKYLLKDKKPINVIEIINHLNRYYFSARFLLQLILYNNKELLSELERHIEEDFVFANQKDFHVNNFHNKAPQLFLFTKLTDAFKNNDFSNYSHLKSSFDSHINLYNQEEKNLIITLLVAACYHNFQAGKPEAHKQLFELNCLMVKNDLIIYDGYIQQDQFWNIVNIGFSVEENVWTENFIKQYGAYLPSTERDDVLSICNAMVSFHNKEFTEALSLLSTVQFQNLLYTIQAKNLQLKCYYELGEIYEDQYWDFTKSFSMFLFRNKNISDSMRNDFKNLIDFSKELYKVKNKQSDKFTDIKKKLINNGVKVASKTWLMEKIYEIEKTKTTVSKSVKLS